MITAVLFGSLSSMTDLTDLERQAFNRTFSDHGIDIHWTPEAYRDLIQRHGRFTGIDCIGGAFGELDLTVFYPDLESHFRDLIDATPLVPNPWFVQASKLLRRKRIRMGLVSGASRQTTLRVLAGLFQSRASVIFDTVTAAEDGGAPKPAPDLFELALTRLHTPPERALAVEVTPQGVAAAQAAGVFTVGLPTRVISCAELSEADDHQAETLQLNIDRFLAHRLKRQPTNLGQREAV